MSKDKDIHEKVLLLLKSIADEHGVHIDKMEITYDYIGSGNDDNFMPKIVSMVVSQP